MIFSLLVKQQMTNANVEKKKMKEKSTKNTSHTEVNNYKNEISIGE